MQDQSVQSERPTSRLTNHASNLSSTLNSFERVSMQLENMLLRIRGAQPENAGIENPLNSTQNEPPVIHRLEEIGGQLQEVSTKLNNQIDELQEYV